MNDKSTKFCTGCKAVKPLEEFNVRYSQVKDVCKDCEAEIKKEKNRKKLQEWRKNNPEKYKAQQQKYFKENKDKINEQKRARRAADPEKTREERFKQYYKDHEHTLKRCAAYREKNREKLFAYEHAEARRNQRAEYRTANKEEIKKRNKAYYGRVKNTEKYQKTCREYYLKNRKEILERTAIYQKRYRKTDRGKLTVFMGNMKRRFRMSRVETDYSENYIVKMLNFFDRKCPYCGASLEDGYHVDHIHPLVLGGNNVKTNVLPVCPTCNSRKATKPLGEFLIMMEGN